MQPCVKSLTEASCLNYDAQSTRRPMHSSVKCTSIRRDRNNPIGQFCNCTSPKSKVEHSSTDLRLRTYAIRRFCICTSWKSKVFHTSGPRYISNPKKYATIIKQHIQRLHACMREVTPKSDKGTHDKVTFRTEETRSDR